MSATNALEVPYFVGAYQVALPCYRLTQHQHSPEWLHKRSWPFGSRIGNDIQVRPKYMKLLDGATPSKAETYGRRQHESLDVMQSTFAGLTIAYRLDHTE